MLAVVHNVTAATRLFDVLDLIGADDRIRIVFTATGSSAFHDGTPDYLARRGVRQLAWDEAIATPFDMAISASYGGDLHLLDAPLMVVPHGMGYNKYLSSGNPETRKPGNPETRKPVFGLSREWLTFEGTVIPSVIALSHAEQLERLRSACPEAVDHAIVAGDVCFDQLAASRALRSSYRRALGLSPGQRLVVVSSTWGAESLYGSWPQVAAELAEQLPVDEFRVALALHPNIWFHHSRWQVNQWTSACRRSGVAVLPGMDDWRSTVVAADLLVGDHGSVGFYSTALGNPLLLAAAPAHTVAPDSPVAALLAAAPRLARGGNLLEQVRAAIAEHDRERYRAITDLTTSTPGQAAALLRGTVYETLRLSEPDEPAEVALLPLPDAPWPRPASYLVEARRTGARKARLTRFPAQRLHHDRTPPRAAHLAASTAGSQPRWLELAEVVLGTPGPHTRQWISQTLRQFPGCVLAAAPDHSANAAGGGPVWLLGDRGGTVLRILGDGELFASVAHRALVDGEGLAELAGTWRVEAGPRHEDVTVAVLTPGE